MIGMVFSYLLGLLLLFGGGRARADLLDTLSTDLYWQLKNVTPALAQLQKDAGTDPAPANIDGLVKDLASGDFATRDRARQDLERLGPAILPLLKPVAESSDAEVAAVGQDLARKFMERGQERVIRRLMAIRTLGERREKEALPQLTALQDSPELFVGAYARRAIAAINGQTPVPEDLSAQFAGDLALLPADSALVGQTRGLATERLMLADLIENAILNNPRINLPVMPNQPPAAPPDTKTLTRQASQQLLTLLERIGNVRIDGITLAFNFTREDKPEAAEHGWVAVIIRGQYDAAAALGALKAEIGEEAKIIPAEKPGEITMIRNNDDEAFALLPDNEHLIFLTAPSKTDGVAILDAFVAAVKTGKGTLEKNQDLAGLLKTVDTQSPLWVASKFNDMMAKEILEGGIKSFTLESKAEKDGTAFTLKAQAADADKAKSAVETVSMELKSALEDLKQEVAVMPAMKPVADMLASIVVKSEGASATMTGKLPNGMLLALLGQLPVLELLTPQPAQMPMDIVPPIEAVPVPDQLK